MHGGHCSHRTGDETRIDEVSSGRMIGREQSETAWARFCSHQPPATSIMRGKLVYRGAYIYWTLELGGQSLYHELVETTR